MRGDHVAGLGLFDELLAPGGTAVLNSDLPIYQELRARCVRRGIEVLSYGIAESDLRLMTQEPTAEGQILMLDVLGRAHRDAA